MGSFSWLAAASGFAASYFNSKFIEERKARIERVNEQLREFVGPLLATVATSHSAWAAMVAQTGLGAQQFAARVAADPSGDEAAAYRAWMTSVLQPLNEKAAKLVFERIDLLDDLSAVPELMQLVAHACTERVVLARWEEGDLAARSRVSYPDGLLAWARREFLRAKGHQASLLGTGGKAAEAAGKAAAGGGGGSGAGGRGARAEAAALALAVPTQPQHLRSRL